MNTDLVLKIEALRDRALGDSFSEDIAIDILDLCDAVEGLQADLDALNRSMSKSHDWEWDDE